MIDNPVSVIKLWRQQRNTVYSNVECGLWEDCGIRRFGETGHNNDLPWPTAGLVAGENRYARPTSNGAELEDVSS